MSRSFNLYRLQQVDSRLDRLRTRLIEIAELLGEDDAVQAAQTEHARAETAVSAARSELRTEEAKTQDLRFKLEQTENRLYGGKVTNPKELQDLQMELGSLKNYLETLEERQLEAMVTLEDAETRHASAAATLKQVAADRIAGNATLSGEQSRLKAEIASLESERAVANNAVTAEDRELYDRLRVKRGGVAVASASSRNCGACGTTLSSTLYQAARSPAQLIFCDTCGRVLYAG
jgi:hypothetical protein